MTIIYIGVSGNLPCSADAFEIALAGSVCPVFVAFPYLEAHRRWTRGRVWGLDSGAFSAANGGEPVSHEAYIATAHRLLAEPDPPSEVYALDLIGDWRASAANAELMRSRGIDCIPTFHRGEPLDVLRGLAADWPKVALGGTARWSQGRLAWLSDCFSAVWPKRIHGFGIGSERELMKLPFHSADSCGWMIGQGFASWRAYGKLRVRGKVDLTPERRAYEDMQARLRIRWADQLDELARLNVTR